MTNFTVGAYLTAHKNLLSDINEGEIESAINMIESTFVKGNKIITCGNGGSAATASHYITDWNKMVNLRTGMKFRGFSLCDNVGLITAYGNDLSYDDVYSGQLAAIVDEGDLLIAISGSGNSLNVIKAVEIAKKNNARTLAIVGYDGGRLMPLCDHSVWIKSFDMQMCEDFHLMFGHMVMKKLCKSPIVV